MVNDWEKAVALTIDHSPVARVLGLILLSKMETDLDYPFLFRKIEEQTLEIDHVIKGINRELEV